MRRGLRPSREFRILKSTVLRCVPKRRQVNFNKPIVTSRTMALRSTIRGVSRLAATTCKVPSSSLHTFARSTPSATIAKAILADGACIISHFYTPTQVASFTQETTPHLQALNPGRSDLPNPKEPEYEQFMKDFHGARTKRLSQLFTKSATFTNDFLNDDALHSICDAVIKNGGGEYPRSDYWLSVAQLISLGPGAEAQMPHTDGAQWWPFFDMSNRQRANTMLLNFLVAISDTTIANGATRIVLDSHLTNYENDGGPRDGLGQADTVGITPEAWSGDRAISVPLKSGDCLLIGGGVVHFGGKNITKDQERKVLSIAVVDSAFTPEEATPVLVKQHVAKEMNERTRRFLGLSDEGMMPMGSLGVWNKST